MRQQITASARVSHASWMTSIRSYRTRRRRSPLIHPMLLSMTHRTATESTTAVSCSSASAAAHLRRRVLPAGAGREHPPRRHHHRAVVDAWPTALRPYGLLRRQVRLTFLKEFVRLRALAKREPSVRNSPKTAPSGANRMPVRLGCCQRFLGAFAVAFALINANEQDHARRFVKNLRA